MDRKEQSIEKLVETELRLGREALNESKALSEEDLQAKIQELRDRVSRLRRKCILVRLWTCCKLK